MSIALSQVLQRVFVRDPNTGEDIWLPERVHAVLRVIFDMVLDDAAERPIAIFVEEIGRRCRKNIRTVQTALKEAEALGIIKRHRINVGRRWHGAAPEREIGATWPISVHWAAIEASKDSHPHSGPFIDGKVVHVPVVYPQLWEKPAGFGGESIAGANSAGKKGAVKDHYPPETGPAPAGGCCQLSTARARPGRSKRQGPPLTAVSPRPPVFPAGASARGGSESDDKAMNEGIDSSQEGKARSLAAIRAFGRPKVVARVAPIEADSRYWTWLVASAGAAGWVERTAGAWKGAEAGDLEFMFLRRGKRSGERAGTFNEQRVSLSLAAACSTALLAQAADWQQAGKIEVFFRPIGDHPLLLLDDLRPEHLALFEGWQGLAVLETSPGNLQASFLAPRCLRHNEIVAAQRALARRCGLTLAAVQAHQPRRGPDGVNNKSSLEAPFVTRLICEPVPGAITVDQLAELLAEDAAHTAAVAAGTVIEVKVVKPAKKLATAASVSKSQAGRIADGFRDSGSEHDWQWLKLRMGRVGGRDRDRLVAELEARAGDRERQGKSPGDPDHLRYAKWTVDRALASAAAKKAA